MRAQVPSNRMTADSGTQALDILERLLAHFSEAPLEVERRSMSIVVTPKLDETFPVTIYDLGEESMIAAGAWHTHIADPEEAAFCVYWLLTPYYRVVEESKGRLLVATWIERFGEDGWDGSDPVYFINPEHPASWELAPDETFVRRYRCQWLLPSVVSYATIEPNAELDGDELPVPGQSGLWEIEDQSPVGLTLL